jgi:hypothetical protein
MWPPVAACHAALLPAIQMKIHNNMKLPGNSYLFFLLACQLV